MNETIAYHQAIAHWHEIYTVLRDCTSFCQKTKMKILTIADGSLIPSRFSYLAFIANMPNGAIAHCSYEGSACSYCKRYQTYPSKTQCEACPLFQCGEGCLVEEDQRLTAWNRFNDHISAVNALHMRDIIIGHPPKGVAVSYHLPEVIL